MSTKVIIIISPAELNRSHRVTLYDKRNYTEGEEAVTHIHTCYTYYISLLCLTTGYMTVVTNMMTHILLYNSVEHVGGVFCLFLQSNTVSMNQIVSFPSQKVYSISFFSCIDRKPPNLKLNPWLVNTHPTVKQTPTNSAVDYSTLDEQYPQHS